MSTDFDPAGKDLSIVQVLADLDLAGHNWVVRDHWDADRCAVGVSDGAEVLAYISTWQKAPGRFLVEIERTPAGADPADYEVVREAEDCGLAELVTILEEALG